MNVILISLLALLSLIVILLLVLLNKIAKDLVVDTQTALKNHRWFKSRLSNLIKVQKKRPFPLTVAILDIDNFRRFNKISIRLGDEMLYEFATHLHNQVYDKISRRNVVRYRFGDEFAIVFENLEYKQVDAIMNSISDTFKNNHLKVENFPDTYFVTFSYGLAEYKTGDSFNSLTERAEEMLVKRKAKRN